MIKKMAFVLILLLASHNSNCQNKDEYQVYALKLHAGALMTPAQNWVRGANPKDSVQACFMVWFLKGENGRNILVDAGYLDTAKTSKKLIMRADLVLQKINVTPSEITDLILTHPHWDHIGGINLFPKAKVWMQKRDFDYFVGKTWKEDGFSRGYNENDVPNIVEINRQGRLKLVEGDNIEIMPGIRVFIGSRHSFENMYFLVNSNSKTNKILIASDAIRFYYNLSNLLPANTTFDPKANVEAMKRIKTLVTNPDLIIPGHDDLIFSKFPKVAEGVVKIGN